MTFQEKFNILSQSQHGFQKNTGSTNAPSQFMSEVHKMPDSSVLLYRFFFRFFNGIRHSKLSAARAKIGAYGKCRYKSKMDLILLN